MNRRDFLKNSALAALLVSPLAVTAKSSGKEVSLVPGSPEWKRLEQAIPAVPTVKPLKPRRLLIFNRNLEYDGHRASILAGSEAFRLFGERTGAFEAVISEDPAMFDRETLSGFDAVFLNNNIGACVAEPERRQNLLEFVTRGGGLMGVHGTSLAFTKWQWPPLEDWAEFGHMIGARGANHRGGYVKEPIVMGLDDAAHPLLRTFGGTEYAWSDEIFRFHAPYSRKCVRVLLKIDTEKTDLSTYKPGDSCLRADNDYALAWVRQYGKGRVFYSALAHSPHVFEDRKMLRFYLDAAQFVLGDLAAPTTGALFWAGSATESTPIAATVEAAYLSGKRAASQAQALAVASFVSTWKTLLPLVSRKPLSLRRRPFVLLSAPKMSAWSSRTCGTSSPSACSPRRRRSRIFIFRSKSMPRR